MIVMENDSTQVQSSGRRAGVCGGGGGGVGRSKAASPSPQTRPTLAYHGSITIEHLVPGAALPTFLADSNEVYLLTWEIQPGGRL